MSVQIPHNLKIENEISSLNGLHLYGIVTLLINVGSKADFNWYKYNYKPLPLKMEVEYLDIPIHCHRCFVSDYRLSKNGELILVGRKNILDKKYHEKEYEEINEKLTGDFWMLMKNRFYDQSIFIPFEDGVIDEDNEKWPL